MGMQSKTQQIDVTGSRETLAGLVRRLGRIGQPVELVQGGRVVARVVPAERPVGANFKEVPREEQEAAWKRLRKLQRKTGKAMKEHGITEEDVMREILKDD